MGEEHEESCECGCEEEMTVEDMIEENNIVLNTLIDFLVEKKIIDEDEFIKKLNSVENDMEAEADKVDEEE